MTVMIKWDVLPGDARIDGRVEHNEKSICNSTNLVTRCILTGEIIWYKNRSPSPI